MSRKIPRAYKRSNYCLIHEGERFENLNYSQLMDKLKELGIKERPELYKDHLDKDGRRVAKKIEKKKHYFIEVGVDNDGRPQEEGPFEDRQKVAERLAEIREKKGGKKKGK